MGEKEEHDLQKVLADTPWSAIVVPLMLALVIIAISLFITLRG